MKTALVRPLASIALVLAFLSGCNKQKPDLAERDVRKVKDAEIVKLDATELNRLATLRMEDQKPADGAIYEITARLNAIDIRETTDNQGSYAMAFFIVPEYAAATIRCEFAVDHTAAVRTLKKGQTVKLRGKFVEGSSSRGEVLLNGCIFVDG
jgi:hypothetical protein